MTEFECSATYLMANSFCTNAAINAPDATNAVIMVMYSALRALTTSAGMPVFKPTTDPTTE